MALFTDTRPIWWRHGSTPATRFAMPMKKSSPCDPAQRQRLIDRLADLPIEMSDVEKIRARGRSWKSLPENWTCRNQQIEWAQKFRRHYREIEYQTPAP